MSYFSFSPCLTRSSISFTPGFINKGFFAEKKENHLSWKRLKLLSEGCRLYFNAAVDLLKMTRKCIITHLESNYIHHHTIIEVFIGFVCVLTPRPFTDLRAPNLACRSGVRKVRRAIGFHGNRNVNMGFGIFYHGSATWLMVLNFCMRSLLWHSDLLAINVRNLPCRFRDST